jgi:hypothetical protein
MPYKGLKHDKARLSKAFKAKSLSITLHVQRAESPHEVQTVSQGSGTNSCPEASDSTSDKLQMEANAGDFHESRRKTRNNSRDADQRRHSNKAAPTQQAMFLPNRLQGTVLINYSLSPIFSCLSLEVSYWK